LLSILGFSDQRVRSREVNKGKTRCIV
jgi:hypothetical protein